MTGADECKPAAARGHLSYSPADRPPAGPFAHDNAQPIRRNAGPSCHHSLTIAYILQERFRWEEPPDERGGSPRRSRRLCFPGQGPAAAPPGTAANGHGSGRRADLLRSVPQAVLHAWVKQERSLRMGMEYVEKNRWQHPATSP